jgi:hypothetical protein
LKEFISRFFISVRLADKHTGASLPRSCTVGLIDVNKAAGMPVGGTRRDLISPLDEATGGLTLKRSVLTPSDDRSLSL